MKTEETLDQVSLKEKSFVFKKRVEAASKLDYYGLVDKFEYSGLVWI